MSRAPAAAGSGARRWLHGQGAVTCSCLLALACALPPAMPRLEAERQASGTAARLQAVHAVDERVVWASGVEGTFALTEDGGASWRAGQVSGAEELQFRDVHAFDARAAFLLAAGEGEASQIYETADGGASWSRRYVNPEPRGFLDCFDFWDRRRGLVYGDSVDGELVVLRTADGGSTWERVAPSGLPPAGDGEGGFAASGTCVDVDPGGRAWIGTGAGGAARVLRTADGGATWDAAETPIVRGDAAGIFSVLIRGPRAGVALGGDLERPDAKTANVATTRDGGATWQVGGGLPFAGAAYGGAWAPGGRALVAVGPGGLGLSLDGGASWRAGHGGELWSVDFGDSDTFWAVGPGGSIVRFDLR